MFKQALVSEIIKYRQVGVLNIFFFSLYLWWLFDWLIFFKRVDTTNLQLFTIIHYQYLTRPWSFSRVVVPHFIGLELGSACGRGRHTARIFAHRDSAASWSIDPSWILGTANTTCRLTPLGTCSWLLSVLSRWTRWRTGYRCFFNIPDPENAPAWFNTVSRCLITWCKKPGGSLYPTGWRIHQFNGLLQHSWLDNSPVQWTRRLGTAMAQGPCATSYVIRSWSLANE